VYPPPGLITLPEMTSFLSLSAVLLAHIWPDTICTPCAILLQEFAVP
jgi:hypothetical protein